jgi:hypothetical protein
MELSHKITGLTDLSLQQLREEWRRLYLSQPPRLSRDLLIRTIAYRMQELAYGGPSKATLRKLQALTKSVGAENASISASGQDCGWCGNGMAESVVVEDGFEFTGKTYSSLSQIARAITGAHWSGPRFFGLSQRARSAPSAMNGKGGDTDG